MTVSLPPMSLPRLSENDFEVSERSTTLPGFVDDHSSAGIPTRQTVKTPEMIRANKTNASRMYATSSLGSAKNSKETSHLIGSSIVGSIVPPAATAGCSIKNAILYGQPLKV